MFLANLGKCRVKVSGFAVAVGGDPLGQLGSRMSPLLPRGVAPARGCPTAFQKSVFKLLNPQD